jgi:hypothetical protein
MFPLAAVSAASEILRGLKRRSASPDPHTVTLHAMENGLSMDAARQALTGTGGAGGSGSSRALQSLITESGSNVTLGTPCLATEEIPVTDEMIDAARVCLPGYSFDQRTAAIYRAMAAVAPKSTADNWWSMQWQKGQDRIAALDAENAKLRAVAPVELYGPREQQLDALRAENAELLRVIGVQNAWIAEQNAKIATFGPQKPADLPDPPRRADGTLAPQAKSWAPPKPTGDPRRIGGVAF